MVANPLTVNNCAFLLILVSNRYISWENERVWPDMRFFRHRPTKIHHALGFHFTFINPRL